MVAARIHGSRVISPLVGDGPLAVLEAAEEAALVPFVADARAKRFDLDEDGVEVAIGGDFLDGEAVAGAFALSQSFRRERL